MVPKRFLLLMFLFVATVSSFSSVSFPRRTHHHQQQQHGRMQSSKYDGVIGETNDDLGAWIPLASASCLFGLGPQRIKVCGVDLVVWHTSPVDDNKTKKQTDASKEVWSAAVDACTHRLAPLSQGRVDPETSCIECPYHGWQFDSEGNVCSIPQLEMNKSISSVANSGGNLRTFPVHLAGDLLFVFLPSSIHNELFPRSILPEEYYPYLAEDKLLIEKQPIFVRDLPYSFDFLVENFMDPAHIPFAHHKLQSTRNDGQPIEMTEIVSNFTHVEATFKDKTRGRARDAYASFQRPSFYHYGEFQEGKRSPRLKIFVAPIEAGKSRVFLYAMTNKIPIFLLHAGSNRFLNSDSWLHDTEREVIRRKEAGVAENKIANLDYIYASKSDLGVSLFRKWWLENGMASSPSHTFAMASMKDLSAAALLRSEQIDPWENHAKHCSHCRKSLKKLKIGQAICLVLAVMNPVLIRSQPIAAIAGSGLFLFARNFLKKTATVIEGNSERSLIDDRSAAALAD